MKLKDRIIEQAIKALQDSEIVNDQGQYNSEYKGYIASFGASIIQSGLLPAVIFYEDSSRSSSEKAKIINAIVRVLKTQFVLYNDIVVNNKDKFSNFIITRRIEKRQIEKDVNEAAVALKLALRTFKEKKDDNKK